MKKIKFVDTVIRNLQPSVKGQDTYWAEGTTGFGIRVGVSGGKSFVSKINQNGKSKFFTLGRYPAMSIRDARIKHDELCVRVENGVDVMAATPDLIQGDATVSGLYEAFLADREAAGYADQRRERTMFVTKVCQHPLGLKRLSAITQGDIERFMDDTIDSIRKRSPDRPTAGVSQGKHLAVLLRTFFDWAVKKKFLLSSPAAQIKQEGRLRPRDRILSPLELYRVWKAIQPADNGLDLALKLVLVTMQRSKEVRYMRWSEIDQGERIWQIPDETAKNRKMHRVPLNRYALELLSVARGRLNFKGDFVFADEKPLYEEALSRFFQNFKGGIGLETVTPHDFRRTGATYLAAVGLPAMYSSLMLNHKQKGVTAQVYIQYSYDFEKRRASDLWEFLLDSILSAESEVDVPNLEKLRVMAKVKGLI